MKKQIETALLKLQAEMEQRITLNDLADLFHGKTTTEAQRRTFRNLVYQNTRITPKQLKRLAFVLHTDPNTLLDWTNFTNSQLTNQEK